MNNCEHALELCCENAITVSTGSTAAEEPVHRPWPKQLCGKRNPNGVGFRIMSISVQQDAQFAQFGEFPWMIALRENNAAVTINDSTSYICGGSLIHPSVILTAAHCVKRLTSAQLIARAGEWDSSYKQEVIPYQERTVSEIVTHAKFSSGPLHNDIALLFLTNPFDYEANVDVICLPQQGIIFGGGAGCVASGWGKDQFGKAGVFQAILKKVDLPLVEKEVCESMYRTTHFGSTFRLHESFICAGDVGKDTCEGDGGSPLVCPIESSLQQQEPVETYYQQVGIVSWGYRCGTHIPGIYVNVPNFRYWIDEQMNIRGLVLQ